MDRFFDRLTEPNRESGSHDAIRYSPSGADFRNSNNAISGYAGCDPMRVNQMGNLGQVAELIKNCDDCSLSQGRNNAVPGQGNPNALVMFIGEGPGIHEDRQGIPFVGAPGKLLDSLLWSIGMRREDVFIANMVKCRPPDNRDPAPPELAACAKYLDRQIELVDPKLIVTLGRFAFSRYFPGEGITNARGKIREKDGRRIFPVLDPAAVLRRDELKPTMVEDFKAVLEILNGEPEEIRIEPTLPVSNILQTPRQNLKVFQLSFMDAPGPAAGLSVRPEISAVNVDEASFPKQLFLF